MIDNLGLVTLPFVALIFLVGGVLLLRGAVSRGGALCVVAGAALFLAAELYGVFTLRPYLGRFFDPDWPTQIAIVESGATLGLLLCAVGLVVHAAKNAR
jgi:hypothetical protein